MPESDQNIGDAFSIGDFVTDECTNYMPMYGTVEMANRYFSEQIYGQLWDVTSLDKKQKAMMTATRAIDNLRFSSTKTDPGQPLEFPRGGQTAVPIGVQRACFEEALARLKGVDPETEYGNTFVKARVFGKIRTDYDFRSVPQHYVVGLASRNAWLLLQAFLNPARNVTIRRGS